jgi:alkylation response protein AidB-like acyl-CoA dehydrogenase
MSRHTVINRRDLDFLLFEWLPLNELLRARRFAGHDSSSIDAVLSVAERLAVQELAPLLRASDITEPYLQGGKVHVLPAVRSAVLNMAEAGLFGAAFDEEFGGSQMPHVVFIAAMGLLMSGSIAAASFMLLTVANARLLIARGTPAQVVAFAKPQISGGALGTMCLSEPHAGSSLADIRTRALPDGTDDHGRRFRLFGDKMWISGGDHDVTDQVIHLVLAKVPDQSGRILQGTRAISLFVVPKLLPDGSINDVKVTGLNHKMGYRALPNCALNFGGGNEAPAGAAGAVGWLVGDIGEGLGQMFHMMNEARIAVGLGGAMLAYRGYLMSLAYARERVQGRHAADLSGLPVVIAEHADVKRMLLAQKAYAEGALALVLYSAMLVDQASEACDPGERSVAADVLSLLTPVSKTWPSEWAQRSLDFAIQIHGGAGYCRDFEIEQLYRDNRLNPIHEGTTGIQAIDLVRRKLRKQQARGLSALSDRAHATIDAAGSLKMLEAQAGALRAAWSMISKMVDTLRNETDEDAAVVHATEFLFAFGHAIVGWLWLDQALACAAAIRNGPLAEAEMNFRLGKLRACRYFCEYELPQIDAWAATIMSATDVYATMPVEQFLGEAK